MLRGVKILIGLVVVTAVSSIVVLLLSLRLARKSIPQTDGTVKLPGLRSICQVYRNKFGVPHIKARNEEDMFYALGYTHAQDRLWQMDYFRRAAMGRLAELFGEEKIESDIFFRTIGLNKIATEIAVNLSPESRNVLYYYIAGINAYIRQNYKKLPIEFALLKYKPELWKIEDVLAIQRLYAWENTESRFLDLIVADIITRAGTRKTNQLFPGYVKRYRHSLNSLLTHYRRIIPGISQQLIKLPDFGLRSIGNTSFCVSASHTKSLKPLLALTATQKATIPLSLYEIRLTAPFIDLYGVSIPGIPMILSGFKENLAWSSSRILTDDLDYFIIITDSTKYRTPAGWQEFENREVIIEVKGKPAVEFTVRETNYGPVISDAFSDSANGKIGVTLKWTGQQTSDEILAGYKIIKARAVNELLDASALLKVPSQQMIFADSAGTFGLKTSGIAPSRRRDYVPVPVPAHNSAFTWNESSAPASSAELINPVKNVLFFDDINHSGKSGNYIAHFFPENGFKKYVRKRLTEFDNCDRHDLEKILVDDYSIFAQRILPDIFSVFNADSIGNELFNYFIDALQVWDYRMNKQEIAPTIFSAFTLSCMENIFKDEMGDSLYRRFVKAPEFAIAQFEAVFTNDNCTWFDDVETSQIEKKSDIILKSLDDTFNLLVQKYGRNIDSWRWGKQHTLSLNHVLGTAKPVSMVLNMEKLALSGGPGAICNTFFDFIRPFEIRFFPTFRMVIDFNAIDSSAIVFATGQSGQPLDGHYKDQASFWSSNYYRKVFITNEVSSKLNYDLLVLKPK